VAAMAVSVASYFPACGGGGSTERRRADRNGRSPGAGRTPRVIGRTRSTGGTSCTPTRRYPARAAGDAEASGSRWCRTSPPSPRHSRSGRDVVWVAEFAGEPVDRAAAGSPVPTLLVSGGNDRTGRYFTQRTRCRGRRTARLFYYRRICCPPGVTAAPDHPGRK